MASLRETELYPPIKALLEGQGYQVKGEISEADVVAVRGGEAPVIVELKTAFALTLVHQGIARQSISDAVYLAVPRKTGRAAWKALKDNIGLCKRLGLGLITVRLRDGLVEIHCDPAPFKPRKSARRKTRMLREFARRVGDPSKGGAMRSGLVTAYRQDALRCAAHLARVGPCKGALVAAATGVPQATRLMASDHYGWFERVETGIYSLTPKGLAGLNDYVVPPPVETQTVETQTAETPPGA